MPSIHANMEALKELWLVGGQPSAYRPTPPGILAAWRLCAGDGYSMPLALREPGLASCVLRPASWLGGALYSVDPVLHVSAAALATASMAVLLRPKGFRRRGS